MAINADGIVQFGEPMKFSPEECKAVAYCPPSAIPTSIVALLGNPAFWNGKSINVFGYITYDIHGSTMYMSTEHCHGNNSEYGIGVRLTKLPKASEFLAKSESCLPANVEGIYEPVKNREPVPGVIKYRDLWPGILNAEYLDVVNQDQ